MSTSTAKKPTETREQRARAQYHDYTYTLGHVRVLMTEREARIPVVTVRKKKDPAQGYAVAIHSEGCTCSCPDYQRNQDRHPVGHKCKHIHCAEMWLTGMVPPLGPLEFDPEFEWTVLERLEESERIERARRDATRIWEDHASL